MMLKLTIALIFVMLGGAVAQTTARFYTDAELDSIATKVVLIYDGNFQLRRFHDEYSTASFEKEQEAYSAWRTLRRDHDDIGIAHYNKYNAWDSIFQIIRCIPLSSLHSGEYIVAAGYDGTLYYLRGFDTNDFASLLRYKIGEIKSEAKALSVAKLYVSTIPYDSNNGVDVVDSSNISQFLSMYPYLAPPAISEFRETYTVRLFTIDPEYKHIVLHNVTLSQTSDRRSPTQVEYQSILMNDGYR